MANIVREIEVTIKKVLSENQYSFEYLDKTFIAVAKDTSEKYEVNDKVIVSVPQSEEDKVIYILRKVGEGGEASSEEEENLGPRISKYISVRDFKHNNEIILTNKYSNSNYANFTTTPIDDAKEIKTLLDQQYNVVRISCKIKTLIPNYDITYGEYGINFRIPVIKDGKAYYKAFSINSNNAYGNPFRFDEYAEQNITFTWDSTEEYNVSSNISPQFYCYVKDFSKNIEYNICSIKDITISFGYMSSTMPNTYNLYLSCNEGIYFTNFNGSKKTIIPVLYYDNKKVTDFTNKKIYWYREDYSVTPEDIAYVEEAGIGWRCINDYTTADNKHFYTSKEILEISSSNYIAKTNKIKCIIKDESDKTLVSNTITIYNNSSSSTNFYLKIKDIDSSIVQSDVGTIRIKAYLEYSSFLDKFFSFFTGNKNRFFKIARYDKDNNYIDNLKVNFTSKNILLNSFIEYESEDIPINIIQEKNIFRIACTSVGGNGIYNNAEIEIKVANKPLYKLEIYSGKEIKEICKKNYKYNFQGKSPLYSNNNAQHGGCYIKNIEPLTYKLYDYEDKEIPLENNSDIEQIWTVNKNSLVVAENSNKLEFNYTLKENYDYDAATIKPIELKVTYKGITIKKKADISFSRETSEGTYGSSVMAGLVPAKDYPSLDYINNYFNNTTPIRFAYYKNKLYYYDYVESRYIPEDEQKIRFYPVIYNKNNFILSKDFSMSSVEIIDTDKIYDNEEDKLKDNNYTNACLKIDNVIDKNYGFTISLKKEASILGIEKLITDNFIDVYSYTETRWVSSGDDNDYDDDDESDGEYVDYYISEKKVRRTFLWWGWDATETMAYDSRIYDKMQIGERTYIYNKDILKSSSSLGGGWINALDSKNDQNVNIIKIKLNYNNKSYEYNCPIEFYNTEVHPEFLPTVKGPNEFYFTKNEDGKVNNISKILNPSQDKYNLPYNYENDHQKISPENIFESAYNTKTKEKITTPFFEIEKDKTVYLKIQDDNYLTSGISKISLPLNLFSFYLEYNESKRQFEEIYFRLSSKELKKLADSKKGFFDKQKKLLDKEKEIYQTELLNLQDFANTYKAKDWLNILTNIKTVKISKDNLNIYVQNLFALTNNINTYFNNDNKFTELCKPLIEYNSFFNIRLSFLLTILNSNDYNIILDLDLDNFDFSNIDYQWDKYFSLLTSNYETIDLVEITSLIELVYEEIEKYQQARQAFLDLRNPIYKDQYANVIKEINNMNKNLEAMKKYEKIYNYIQQNVSDFNSINNIENLYIFIDTLYDLYLKSLFDKQNDDNIVLKPERQFIYENLINKNNKAISYYGEAYNYCESIIESYNILTDSGNNHNLPENIDPLLLNPKYIHLIKPIVYHVRENYEYIDEGNS